MNTEAEKATYFSNFRTKSTLGVVGITLVLLTPFTINNFLQGRHYLGIGSLVVVALCAMNAWNSIHHRYHPTLIFWGLVPAITLFLTLSLYEQGAVITYWAYVALLSFYFMLPERQAWTANVAFLAIVFPVAWGTLEFHYMTRFVVTTLGVSAFSAMFVRVISDQQKMLEQQAITDPLTGLLNRMRLNDTLDQAIQQNLRTGIPMTLIALDLDHFKSINDEYGHDGGDRVLRGVSDFFKSRIRTTDKVFRIGGEEFLILLFDTDTEHSLVIAEELRSGLQSLQLVPDHQLTVSIGIAALQSGEDREEWMKRCDEKLFQAKSSGRNLVKS